MRPPLPTSLKTPTKDLPEKGSPKLVQMRMRPKTLEQVEHLQHLTGIDNRTQVVASAIQLAEWLVTTISKGGKLSVEWPDGEKETVTLVGL